MAENVGYATLTIIPSARGFRRKLQQEVGADIDAVGRQVGRSFGENLSAAASNAADVDVDTSRATGKIRSLVRRITRLGQRDVKVDVDVDGASAARSALAGLGAGLTGVTASAKIFNTAILAAGAALPVLTTAAAVAAAGVGGLAAVATVAGAGIAAFAVSAVGNLNKVTEAVDELTKVREDLNEARREGDQAKVNELLAEQARILGKLTPAQRGLVKAIQDAKAAYDKFLAATSKPVGEALTAFIRLTRPALKLLTPITLAAAQAIEKLGVKAGKALGSPFWADFAATIRENVAPAFDKLGRIGGNVLEGLAGIVEAFLPSGQRFLDFLVSASEDFAQFGKTLKNNPQFKQFLAYVKENGPKVVGTLKDIAAATKEIAIALGLLGAAALEAKTKFEQLDARFADDKGLFEGMRKRLQSFLGFLRTFVADATQLFSGLGYALSHPLQTAHQLIRITMLKIAVAVLGGFTRLMTGVIAILAPLPGHIERPFRQARGAARRIVDGLNADIGRRLDILTGKTRAKLHPEVRNSFNSAFRGGKIATNLQLTGIEGRARRGAARTAGNLRPMRSSVPRIIGGAFSAGANAANRQVPRVVGAARNARVGAVGQVRGMRGGFWSAGWNAVSSLASAIYAGRSGVISAAISVAVSAISAARNALGIGSPSKVFTGMGLNVGRSFISAILSLRQRVADAASQLAGSAVDPVRRAAREVLAHLRSGGNVFEDFSFRGASGLVSARNDALARRFYRTHPGFDFGQPGTRAALERFLARQAAGSVSGGDRTIVVNVNSPFDREDAATLQRRLTRMSALGMFA